jgi:hypothetical protein
MMIRDKSIITAERRGLCSVSNNTKWRQLLPMVKDLPCHKRIKFIDSDEPTRWQIGIGQPHPGYVEASGGPEKLKFVEWIEVERFERRYLGRLVPCEVVDHSERIRTILTGNQAAFKETDASFLIYGYTCPSVSPGPHGC